jgi:hypothetical protein
MDMYNGNLYIYAYQLTRNQIIESALRKLGCAG